MSKALKKLGKKVCFQPLRGSRGATIISTLIAAGIIVTSIGAITIPAMQLHRSMKKAELANLAVVIEANLISSFHNQINFTNETPAGIAANTSLRAGQIPPTFNLQTSFVPVIALTSNAARTEASSVGFLEKNLAPCTAYSHSCVLRYEVRMKKMGTASYAFSYQVDVNPDVMQMVSLGDAASYSSPIDSGLYRAEAIKTKCVDGNDLFMRGMNRDTGEAFCVERPDPDRCEHGRLPKGLLFEAYTSNPKAGVLRMRCTPAIARSYVCPQNYALQQFEPKWVDPENDSYGPSAVPGRCVFRTSTTSTMPNALPPNPTSPYLRRVDATVCPPYYRASNSSSCQLVPDAARNASSEGQGRCGSVAYKNCSRVTSTTSNDGGAARNAWNTCMALVPPPAAGCGPAPANPVYYYSCYRVQTSTYCNGTVDAGGPDCASNGGWDSGTAYAYNIQDYSPTASTTATFSGRTESCRFTDTSAPCTAPARTFDGTLYGRKNAKWFGGVQISGATCTIDPALVGSITVPATGG